MGGAPAVEAMKLPGASWLRWWRVTGLAGIIYGLGTAALALFPSRDFFRLRFLITDVQAFFAEREPSLLVVVYLEAMLAGFFLLVFSSGLRSYLSRAEGGYSMWSHLVLGSGSVAAAITLAVHPVMKTLALVGVARIDPGVLGATVRFESALQSTVVVPLATMVLAASVVDLKTGVFAKWVGGLGVAATLLLFLGAAWPLTGSSFGLLGFALLYGRLLLVAWFVAVGMKLILVQSPPLHVPGEGLFDPGPMIEGWRDEPE